MKNYLIVCALFLTAAVLLCSAQEGHDISARSVTPKPKLQDTCRCLPGLPGRDGRDGRDAGLRGPPGKQGPRGPRGARGPTGKSGEIAGGAVYTRWGKQTCPNTNKTTKLYSGVVAGADHGHSGAGSNYLCLPLYPIYEKVTKGNQDSSYIYGTEYEFHSGQNKIFQNSNLQNHEAVCAVCHTESRGSHVMIPARNVCPSGWTMEYKGYIMSAHHGHTGRTQFICVDGNAEATFGSHDDKNGALLYFVESHCGSLPCPPYVQGYELTCVVCTK